MKDQDVPALDEAGNEAEQVILEIGDDPETMLLAIALMDRMISRRGKRGRKKLTKRCLTR